MKRFGEFITRSFWQAGFCALLFALLPLMSWVAIVIVGLTTLCRGPREGFIVLLWACLPSIAIMFSGWYESVIQLTYFSSSCIVVLLMAWLLRRMTWSSLLQIFMGVSLVAVVGLRYWYPQLIEYLQNYVGYMLSQASQAGITLADIDNQTFIDMWSTNAVRLLVVSITGFSYLWLLLARKWQINVFNLTQLQYEWQFIRLNKWLATVSILGLAALWLVSRAWFVDLVPVIVLPLSIAGLSVLHRVVAIKQFNKAWLIGFYGVLLVVIEPIALSLAVVAFIDSWIDIRQRLQVKRG